MPQKSKKGMTLIEILVSVALFGLFSTLVVSLVVSSLRNYQDGQIRQNLRQQTSKILHNIQEDITKAYLLPTMGNGSWVPSAVLLPNPYGSASLADKDGGSGLSANRLILSMAAVELDQIDITNPVPNLRYVEYIVPDASRNKLFRRSYTFGITLTGYNGFGRDVSNNWVVDDAYFTLSNVNQSVVVAELPGAGDTIDLEIQRIQLPSLDYSYNTNYDRHLFRIKCKLTKFKNDDPASPVTYEEQMEVKIRAD